MKRLLISLCLLALCPLTFALRPANMAMCPAANELRLDQKRFWWATKVVHDDTSSNSHAMLRYKWYSTSPSLAQAVDHFSGAQFVGTTEGHIVCLYAPAIRFNTQDFPILVYFESLALRPKGASWKADKKKAGIVNCINGDPSGCPYLVYQPSQIQDPYQVLRALKAP